MQHNAIARLGWTLYGSGSGLLCSQSRDGKGACDCT